MIQTLKYFILFLLVIELVTRVTRISDFPLYDANNKIGYIPQANQKGRFLWSHDWKFNEYHMGADSFKPSNDEDLLLIGDSIVLGGNQLKESEKLGPSLQGTLNVAVWPIAAGGWSMRNELIYLNSNPEIVRNIDTFIFVWNSGDFDQASSWSCEITHPLHAPISAFFYVFQKYVYSFHNCTGDINPELLVPNGDWQEELKGFINSAEMKNKKVVAYLYPNLNEEIDAALMKSGLDNHINEIHQAGISNVISIGHDSRWSIKYYRDDIHPNGIGNKALAKIISEPEAKSIM